MLDPNVPGDFETFTAGFTVTNGTKAKLLVPPQLARVGTAIAGETALPGEAAVRQRVFTGGVRIFDGTISSSDAASKDMRVWTGKLLTSGADMGATSITTQNKLGRTAGSFLTDGWQVGEAAMLFGDTTDANNGTPLVVTAVTASELTFNGTLLTNGAPPATLQVYRIALRKVVQIPANSGNTNALRNVSLLAFDNTIDVTGLTLGKRDALIVGMASAVAALPAQVCVTAHAGLY